MFYYRDKIVRHKALRGSLLVLMFVLGLQVAIASRAQAKEENSEQQQAVEEYKKKAKLRLYPGGADEQDLKIQTPLLSIFRKMNPVIEAPPVEDTPSDD